MFCFLFLTVRSSATWCSWLYDRHATLRDPGFHRSPKRNRAEIEEIESLSDTSSEFELLTESDHEIARDDTNNSIYSDTTTAADDPIIKSRKSKKKKDASKVKFNDF